MTRYTSQLEALHRALVERDGEVMSLVAPARLDVFPVEARLAVYADGYRVRLVSSVLADYPALTALIGEAMMRRHVEAFVASTPSLGWDLNHYSIGFAHFMRGQGAASDVAMLESAIVACFWGEACEPVDVAQLMGCDEAMLGNQSLRLRKASKLLALEHDAQGYVTAFRRGETPREVAPGPCYLLVVRAGEEATRLVLDDLEYRLLRALDSGLTFAQALDAVDDPALEGALAGYMSRWLSHQIFRAV